MIAYDDVEAIVAPRVKENILIAIDGRPVSGKSTISEKLAVKFGLSILCLDDFMTPPDNWRGAEPAFPFPYFRHDEFDRALHDLKTTGACAFGKYDWLRERIRPAERLEWTGALLVEGCSVLKASLAPLYNIRFFVESDARDTYDAVLIRDGGTWAQEWRELFLPCAEIYMATNPQSRADHIVAGRQFGGAVKRS